MAKSANALRFYGGLVSLAAGLLLVATANAAVVKWTDEHGKIHYGDRVPEKYKQQAEQIQVESTNVIRNDNKAPNRITTSPKSHQMQQPYRSEMSEEDALLTMCKEAARQYTQLTTVRHTKDRNSAQGDKTIESTVLRNEQGESYTRREQNRLAEEFRLDVNRKGCNIPQTKNMKL